jgi:hypothetical protein
VALNRLSHILELGLEQLAHGCFDLALHLVGWARGILYHVKLADLMRHLWPRLLQSFEQRVLCIDFRFPGLALPGL